MAAMADDHTLLGNMESEERPAKMRKLEHAEDEAIASHAEMAPASTTSDHQTTGTTQNGQIDDSDIANVSAG